MIHSRSIVLTEICQFSFYEGADGREMRMDIHRESSLCHTCTLGRARSTRLLVGDPSWHRDRSDVPLAKHKRPDQRAITTLCADVTTGYDMIIWTGGYYFPPVMCYMAVSSCFHRNMLYLLEYTVQNLWQCKLALPLLCVFLTRRQWAAAAPENLRQPRCHLYATFLENWFTASEHRESPQITVTLLAFARLVAEWCQHGARCCRES